MGGLLGVLLDIVLVPCGSVSRTFGRSMQMGAPTVGRAVQTWSWGFEAMISVEVLSDGSTERWISTNWLVGTTSMFVMEVARDELRECPRGFQKVEMLVPGLLVDLLAGA